MRRRCYGLMFTFEGSWPDVSTDWPVRKTAYKVSKFDSFNSGSWKTCQLCAPAARISERLTCLNCFGRFSGSCRFSAARFRTRAEAQLLNPIIENAINQFPSSCSSFKSVWAFVRASMRRGTRKHSKLCLNRPDRWSASDARTFPRKL